MRDVCLPLAAQRGQALIESVLLLSLLTLLLHAALGLGRAQRGHAAGQFQPQGRHDHDRAGRPCPCTTCAMAWPCAASRSGSRRIRVRREPVLRNDWLGEARLVQVRADTTVAMPPPFSGLRISRQVQVLSGRDMHG